MTNEVDYDQDGMCESMKFFLENCMNYNLWFAMKSHKCKMTNDANILKWKLIVFSVLYLYDIDIWHMYYYDGKLFAELV